MLLMVVEHDLATHGLANHTFRTWDEQNQYPLSILSLPLSFWPGISIEMKANVNLELLGCGQSPPPLDAEYSKDEMSIKRAIPSFMQ